MPTGYPKDPAAYAAKQAIASRKRAEAKAEKFGQPVKRTAAANSAPTPVTSVVEDDHAYTEKKNPIKRAPKKRTYKPSASKIAVAQVIFEEVAERKIKAMQQEIIEQDNVVKQLHRTLAARNRAVDELEEEIERYRLKLEDAREHANTTERRLFALLDLI